MASKFVTALYAFIFLLFFCGCENSGPPGGFVLSDFSADFSAEYKGLGLSGSLSCAGRGLSELELSSPDSLKGIRAGFKGGELELKLDTLICTADEAYIPENGFLRLSDELLKQLPQALPDSDYKCDVTLFDSICCLSFSPDGTLLSAECPAQDFSIELSGVERS